MAGKAVITDQRPGPPLHLLRSLGMGGPASPFFWCLGLDPILYVLQEEARAVTPTYVDDIAGMVQLRHSLHRPILSHVGILKASFT